MIHANAAVMKPKMAVPLRSRMGWSVFRESSAKYTVLVRTNKNATRVTPQNVRLPDRRNCPLGR